MLTILPGADMALVTRNVLAVGRRRTTLTIVGICTRLRDSRDGVGARIVRDSGDVGHRVQRGEDDRRRVSRLDRRAVDSRREGGQVGRREHGSEAHSSRTVPSGIPYEHPESQGRDLLPDLSAAVHLAGRTRVRRSLLLAAIHIAMGFVWLTAYAWFVDRLGAVLTRPRVKAWLERVDRRRCSSRSALGSRGRVDDERHDGARASRAKSRGVDSG